MPAKADAWVLIPSSSSLATARGRLVLLLGLANMLRGGSPNRSQNLMRLRVVLQAVAIVLIVLVLWWRGH